MEVVSNRLEMTKNQIKVDDKLEKFCWYSEKRQRILPQILYGFLRLDAILLVPTYQEKFFYNWLQKKNVSTLTSWEDLLR